MKIKKNPELEVGERVYLADVHAEPNFVIPARGKVTKILVQGYDQKGKPIIQYTIKWDEGTKGGQPILSDVDIFYRESDWDKTELTENYVIQKSDLYNVINKLVNKLY
jgi:hypothetical protein